MDTWDEFSRPLPEGLTDGERAARWRTHAHHWREESKTLRVRVKDLEKSNELLRSENLAYRQAEARCMALELRVQELEGLSEEDRKMWEEAYCGGDGDE